MGRAMAVPHLKGKILAKPTEQIWMLNQSKIEDDHKYTAELGMKWTPLNSNLCMNSIKVRVSEPVPMEIIQEGSFEDTMLILEMVKEKKLKENRMKKEEMIRSMALQQKMKKQRN